MKILKNTPSLFIPPPTTIKHKKVYSKIWHILVWTNQFDQVLKKQDVFYFMKLIWWKRANQS